MVLLANVNRYGATGLKRLPDRAASPASGRQPILFQSSRPSDEDMLAKTRSLSPQQVVLAKITLDMELGQPILWQGNIEMSAIDLLSRIRKQEFSLLAQGYPSSLRNIANWALQGSGLSLVPIEEVYGAMLFLENRGLLHFTYDKGSGPDALDFQKVDEVTVTRVGDEVLNSVPRSLIESDYQDRLALRKKAETLMKVALVEHQAQQKNALVPLMFYQHPATGYSGWQLLKRLNTVVNEQTWMKKLWNGKETLSWAQIYKALDSSNRLDKLAIQAQVLALIKQDVLQFVQTKHEARSYIRFRPGLKPALDAIASDPMTTFNLTVSHIRGWFQAAQKQSKEQVLQREQHLIQMEKEAEASRMNCEDVKRGYQTSLKALKQHVDTTVSTDATDESERMRLVQRAESLRGRLLLEEDVQKGLERWMNTLRFQFAEWQLTLESNVAQRDRLMIGLEGTEQINQPQQLVSQLILLFDADKRAHDALDNTLNQLIKDAIKKTGPTDWRLSVKNPLNQTSERLSVDSRIRLLLSEYRPEPEPVKPQTDNPATRSPQKQSTPKAPPPPPYSQFYGEETEKDI
jgi:hypothetical protein